MSDHDDHSSHDSSIPPPPSRQVSATDHDEVAKAAAIGRSRSKEALAAAQQALAASKRVEAAVGRSPDPALGQEGTGMLGAMTRLIGRFDGFEAKLEERFRRELAAAEDAKRSWWGSAARWAALALGAAGTAFGIWKGLR